MKFETLSENTSFVSSLIKNNMCKAGLQYLDNYSAIIKVGQCVCLYKLLFFIARNFGQHGYQHGHRHGQKEIEYGRTCNVAM